MLVQRFTVFLFFLFLSGGLVKAQDTAFYFAARVVNAENGAAITNARITLKGTFRGTYSDNKGDFLLLAKKSGSVIEISAPGYATAYCSTPFLLNPEKKKIKLDRVENAEESAVSWEKVFRSGKWNILDFNLNEKGIFLVARDEANSHQYLHHLTSSGEIISSTRLPESFHAFYATAKGEKFLVCTDNAFALQFSTESKLILGEKISIKDFEKKYYSWPAEDAGNRYLQYDPLDEYFVNNQLDLIIRQTFLTLYAQTKRENRRILFKNLNYEKFEKPAGNWKKFGEISLSRPPFANENVKYIKIPVQLFQAEDHLVFFDLEAKKAETYDSSGKLINTAIFYSARIPSIENKIAKDETKGTIYYCTLEQPQGDSLNPVTVISEINIMSGKLSKKVTLGCSAYTTIRISDGFVYYLKKESRSSARLFLARTKL
jgi:hypothetical protein